VKRDPARGGGLDALPVDLDDVPGGVLNSQSDNESNEDE
jgi:hypothetical protein